MTIYYLMVKTHRITGLKYLCQTKRSDPYKYTGSGKYWKRHIKVHGNHIDTQILRECQTKEELSELGRHYSNLYNIVESSEWANLKPETGQGGNIQTQESIAKGLKTRLERRGTLRTTGDDIGQKVMKTKLERYRTVNTATPESITKSINTKIQRYGSVITTEMKMKEMETNKRNGTGNYCRMICPHCGKESGKPNYTRSHGDKCKFKPE